MIVSRLLMEWIILEQVFIAALDVSDEDLALECLNHLRTQFKKSSRVNRLSGLYLEKKQRFEDAHAVYTQLLNEDPTNILARKRMIAILKAQRKITEAIDNLRQYLNTFMSDFEAWNELADLYLMEGDYKHAAFCMEEMLLSNPHNHLYCQRYAEVSTVSVVVEQSVRYID
ncbi:ER membrane protein complex subunit [Fasciola hepatica]|uniref:ER membrane protein complex subunit 2 n=1 Tax=Fasciola hepatica TaxID=6192 RepID=A0A4E0RVW5_FASHE|nr:ER membrane protein complex subunit [Fasciola hepatica]